MRVNCIASHFVAVVIATVTLSCTSRPVKDYAYANLDRLQGWKGNTGVTLDFEMMDTTGTYTLYIVGEVATQRSSAEKRGMPVQILLTSPDGIQYKDSVTLPLRVIEDGKTGKTSHGVREIVWPYRKNIHNKIPGLWSITFFKGDEQENYNNVLGLGIHCKQDR